MTDPLASHPLLAGVRLRGMVSYYVRSHLDPRFRGSMRLARQGLILPSSDRTGDPAGAIWAVTMVKNEADMVEATIRHLIAQGVDRVLVADNGSTDGTLEILEGLAAERHTVVCRDVEVGFYQAAKMTLLARYAASRGASWIVPFDADELWFAPGASLSDFLSTRAEATVAQAEIYNAFPCGDPSGRLRIELTPHFLSKVAFRPHPLALLEMGNHWTSRVGPITTGLRIVHIPWRTEQQLVRKLRQGAAAMERTGKDLGVGAHWRASAGEDDVALKSAWNDVLTGRPNEPLEWSPSGGPTVIDDPLTWSCWPRHWPDPEADL